MATGDPQISWQTIVGAVIIVGLVSGGQWVVSQTEFASIEQTQHELRDRIIGVEAEQKNIIAKLAHDPVEQRTFQAVVDAEDKHIDLLQAQIQDINRQIAAALIIIDNNAVPKKSTPALPP